MGHSRLSSTVPTYSGYVETPIGTTSWGDLEKRPGQQVGEDHSHDRQQGDFQADGTQGHVEDQQVEMRGPEGGGHGPGKEFLSRTRGEKSPQQGGDEASQDESHDDH